MLTSKKNKAEKKVEVLEKRTFEQEEQLNKKDQRVMDLEF